MGAVRGAKSGHRGVDPDINVTPLVDVVLVLLIIFMVVTPQLENDVNVDLPKIFNVDPERKQAVDPLEISIAQDGTYWVDKAEVDEEALDVLFAEVRKTQPDRRVVLRADVGQGFEDVRPIFALIRQAGFPGAALSVNEVAQGEALEGPAVEGTVVPVPVIGTDGEARDGG